MQCFNCGNMIQDGTPVCPICGALLFQGGNQMPEQYQQPQFQQSGQYQQAQFQQPGQYQQTPGQFQTYQTRQPQTPAQTLDSQKGDQLAIAALIGSIGALILSFVGETFGIIFSIVMIGAAITSIRSNCKKKGLAFASLVILAVAIVISVIMLVSVKH